VAIIFEIFWRCMEFDCSLVFRFEALVERLNVSFPDRSSREVSTDKSGPVTTISLIPDIVGQEKSTMSRRSEVNARTSHLAARGERLDAG